MLHLALKAFRPGRLPFPVMHVDTGHNFDEVIATRDELVAAAGVRLVVASVQDDIDAGRVVETIPSRNPIQTVTLLRAIRENQFDAAFGEPGATRRRPAPRSGCSASATSSASGTRRLSGRNCGTSTTDGTTRASTSGSSRCPTGPNSTSGPTSAPSRSGCRPSISPTGARCFSATACCWPCTGTCNREPTSRCSRPRCDSAPSGMLPAPGASSRRHRRSRKSSPKLRWPA